MNTHETKFSLRQKFYDNKYNVTGTRKRDGGRGRGKEEEDNDQDEKVEGE